MFGKNPVFKILKELGLGRFFAFILILRLPFDFLNSVLAANMLEKFLRLAEGGNPDNLWRTFALFLLLTVLLFGYNASIWATVSIKADMLLQKRIRERLLKNMLKRNGFEMEKYSAGDWITRLNNDADRLNDYLTTPINFMHVSIAGLNILLSSIILIVINPSLYLAAILVMVPFFILSSVIIIRKIPHYRKNAQDAFATYTNYLEPLVTANEAINIFDGEDLVLRKIDEASNLILRENMKAHRLSALSSFFNIISGNLGYLLLLLLGNSMIGMKVRDFAELSKITQYRAEMMKSVGIVNAGVNGMKTNISGAVRIEEILQNEQ
ncbi:MAG: ABC transporter ATP-binding protein [Lachnospiraceae bacterium]|nr:ABC transporter ATP-binding protein [Lachnospiraceae bacterium]